MNPRADQAPAPPRELSHATPRTRWPVAVAVAMTVSFAMAGCSDDGTDSAGGDPGDARIGVTAEGEDPATQPQVGTETFGQGDFGDIPLIAGSEQIGPTGVQEDEVITATYTVNQMVAARAVDQMAQLLAADGWNQLIGPVERPLGAFRTEYVKDGRRVEVVATDVTGLRNENRMQYSVILHPDADVTDIDRGRAATD